VLEAGKLIVATEEGGLTSLSELERRGAANGVEGLHRLAADEIREVVEPEAAGAGALHSPNTGIVDFVAVAESYAADVARAGGTIHLGAGVPGSSTSREQFDCAMRRAACGDGGLLRRTLVRSPRGRPRRPGRPSNRPLPRRLLGGRRSGVRCGAGQRLPVPDPNLPFLGAHLTRTLDGRLLIGPSALIAPARDAYRL
jgi:L-2-hydroxyglutarate oxidase LhgO